MGDPRRTYQQRVGSLLKAIDERHRHQLALMARGVTRMGMLELESEIQALRDELAAVIAAGSDAVARGAAAREVRASRSTENRRRRVPRTTGARPVAAMHSAASS